MILYLFFLNVHFCFCHFRMFRHFIYNFLLVFLRITAPHRGSKGTHLLVNGAGNSLILTLR